VIILGINQDRYDSGVTLVDANRVLYAANEERFTRRKTQGGFPARSLNAAFEFTDIDMAAVDRICVAGLMTPPLPVRIFPKLHHVLFEGESKDDDSDGLRDRLIDFVQNRTPLAHTT
jgi:carbamoyltransferase